MREAGATEVHVRVTCPPIAHPCFFGVDMGTYDELIAHQLGVPEICDHIGADSLGFLSVDRMMKALGPRRRLLQRLFHRLRTRSRCSSARWAPARHDSTECSADASSF